MRFDPGSQSLKCDYCGTMADPKNLNADVVSPESKIRLDNKNIFEAKIYTCPQCGAELVCDDDTAATFCNYCGASVMFDERTVTMKAPSYVIPFSKTKEQCQELYGKFIKKAIFAPKYLRENETVERFRGIYMPYWVYDMAMDNDVHVAGKKSHRSGDYIITDHYDLATHVRSNSNGVSFDASAAYADELSQSIAPYNFKECQEFSAGYLSGFYVDTADVEAETYLSEAKDAISADVATHLLQDATFSKYSAKPEIADLGQRLTVVSEEMAYFPVWFLSTTQNGYVSYAVVNGQTGKVSADIPIDYKKYVLGSLIASIPVMLILNLFFTPRPVILAIITAVFAIIMYVIANRELNELYTRTHYLDDRGLRNRRNETMPENISVKGKKPDKVAASRTSGVFSTIAMILFVGIGVAVEMDMGGLVFAIIMLVMLGSFVAAIVSSVQKGRVSHISYKRKKYIFKQPFKEKAKVLVKPLIAMGLCVLLMIINPFMDMIYYVSVLAIMVLVLTCIWDVVKIHNQLTRRLPKQFGVRGGADNESNF